MQIIEKSIKDIHPYENNPRFNDNAVDAVAASIKEFGFKNPIIIDSAGVIVAGHTRYKAAKKLQLSEVPCIVADDLTEEQITAFRLADNKVGELATWDFDLLNLELDNIADIDMSDFGFELESISPDDFGDSFSLDNTDAPKTNQITVIFSARQKEEVLQAMAEVKDVAKEVDGNTNVMGNCFYEVVRQWAELKKSS